MKIGVAMSGGVDSSAAAVLLKEQGHEVIGVTLLLCENENAANDAAETAKKLGMEFHAIDMREEFRAHVIDKFISDYENGRTPNPCVVCNREIKFALLLQAAEKLGCDAIATGHYARIEKTESGRVLLKKGIDASKDQSYMLYSLSQAQLSKVIFPLGGLIKTEVRKIAEKHGLLAAHKKDSQDICFIPDGDYAGFIEKNSEKAFEAGDFIGTNGEIYGRHKGIIHYTVGQRKGLGLSFPQPMFVKSIDVSENTVMLCKAEELFSSELYAKEVNIIAADNVAEPIRLKAKIRYHHKEAAATAYPPEKDVMKIVFDEQQRAVTKGQSVVLYQDDIVFGGGIII